MAPPLCTWYTCPCVLPHPAVLPVIVQWLPSYITVPQHNVLRSHVCHVLRFPPHSAPPCAPAPCGIAAVYHGLEQEASSTDTAQLEAQSSFQEPPEMQQSDEPIMQHG